MKTSKLETYKNLIKANANTNEEVEYITYGIKDSNIFLLLFLSVMAGTITIYNSVLPTLLLVFLAVIIGSITLRVLLKKRYIIGLSQSQLIILQVNSLLSVQKITIYNLNDMEIGEVLLRTSFFFTHLRWMDKSGAFEVKFHKNAFPENRRNAIAIGEVLKESVKK